ncbi:MAG: hypothetical protein ACPGUD_07070 [Parashewanella sp.]
MKYFPIVIMFYFLNGCAVPIAALNCLKGTTSYPKSDVGTYNVQVASNALNLHLKTTISCEKYYDTQCSTRGNEWRFRSTTPLKNQTIQINDIQAEVVLPDCEALIHDPQHAKTYLLEGRASILRYQKEGRSQELYQQIMSAQKTIQTKITKIPSQLTK